MNGQTLNKGISIPKRKRMENGITPKRMSGVIRNQIR
jgi:hypothetical protein